MVDLHTHSTASDGSLAPAELAALAAEQGVQAIALTDHDTVDGLEAFFAAPVEGDLRRVAGVEISTAWHNHSQHILGLFIDPAYYPLRELLSRLQFSRRQRADRMLKLLGRCGHELQVERLQELAAPGAPGRSHLAQLLVEAGICQQPQEAFDRYLGRGKPAHVSLELPSLREVTTVIHGAGGVAIWAHPTGFNRRSSRKVRKACQRMMEEGLDGLEAYYAHYTPEQQQNMQRVANELGLLVSGGSDFHGVSTPGVSLGTGKGDLNIPFAVYEELAAKHENILQGNLRRLHS